MLRCDIEGVRPIANTAKKRDWREKQNDEKKSGDGMLQHSCTILTNFEFLKVLVFWICDAPKLLVLWRSFLLFFCFSFKYIPKFNVNLNWALENVFFLFEYIYISLHFSFAVFTLAFFGFEQNIRQQQSIFLAFVEFHLVRERVNVHMFVHCWNFIIYMPPFAVANKQEKIEKKKNSFKIKHETPNGSVGVGKT